MSLKLCQPIRSEYLPPDQFPDNTRVQSVVLLYQQVLSAGVQLEHQLITEHQRLALFESTNQNLVLFCVDQSEVSIVLFQPIRVEYLPEHDGLVEHGLPQLEQSVVIMKI